MCPSVLSRGPDSLFRSETPAPRERAGTVLSVRFSPEELYQLKREAERAGLPVSAFARKFALAPRTTFSFDGTANNASVDHEAQLGIQWTASYGGTYSVTIGSA